MSGEMVKATPVQNAIVQPTFNEVSQMAAAVYQSGLFACKSKEQALTLMLLCQAENLHPINAMRQFHIIQGRPSMRSDAMLARFQKSGGRIEWHERGDKSVSASFSHAESCPTPVKVEWTIEQAQRAGVLGNDTWKKYPRQMLTARVISEGVRTVLPEVCVGLYTPEEAGDMEPMKTPAPLNGARQVASAPVEDEADPLADDEGFLSAFRVAAVDREFSEAAADAVLKRLLDDRQKTLADLTADQRRQTIAKVKAGAFDGHLKAFAPFPLSGFEDLPDPCDYDTIMEVAVSSAPDDIDAPMAMERFGAWLKLQTSKKWDKLSSDEQIRVFKAIKTGEPWAVAAATA